MAEYIAERIIEKANGGDGLEYKEIITKWIDFKEFVDKELSLRGKGDLIEEL